MSNSFFSKINKILTIVISLIFFTVIVGAVAVLYVVFHYSKDLPDYSSLKEYSPPTVTRLYAADGRILEEYAKEKRLFVPINAIPDRLVNAFIAAEDQNFYTHLGVDPISIARATVQNITNIGKNKPLVGGSTITQQVVKNFLLTNEKSLDRKIKEAILSFRITQAFSKDKIMELYLNEIYLGNRSYGVAAAALNYFNKSIDELTIEESAMLASLPKAPSTLDPRKFPERAKARRDWVISRMEKEGFIDNVSAVLAQSKPIKIDKRDETEIVGNAGYFSESVRQELESLYGEEGVYEKGLTVHTTLVPKLQNAAEEALQKGLLAYDKRHGWRGALTKINLDNWQEELQKIKEPAAIGNWQLAVVYRVESKFVQIGLKDGSTGGIILEDITWARKYYGENGLGAKVKKMSDVLKLGDVILVKKFAEKTYGEDKITLYSLQQIPKINGALVAIDPHSGKTLAMSGGYYYGEGSKFNRATQAKRQPGSAFKPFVYLAALENGFSPNSIIVDEEVQLERGEDLPGWRPKNYSGKYYGPTTMRVGVEKSRNAMTVRLSQLIGVDKIVEISDRFGISDNTARNFSVALGSAETNLLDLTNAYAMLVNGGKRVSPSLVERIQNSSGANLYKHDTRSCEACIIAKTEEIISDESDNNKVEGGEDSFSLGFNFGSNSDDNASLTDDDLAKISPPVLKDERSQVVDPIAAYQMVSFLEGAIQRGTGKRAKSLNKVLAGKTGTTNDTFDAWFVGFSADLAVGVYVGFDNPKSLGRYETGASAALPIWTDFMKEALKDADDTPFRRPSGVKLVKIDATTGFLPSPDTLKENIIFEAFKAGTEPTSSSQAINNSSSSDNESETEEFFELDANEVY